MGTSAYMMTEVMLRKAPNFRFRLGNLPRLFPAAFPAPPSFHKSLI
jgi:hypothetical protein